MVRCIHTALVLLLVASAAASTYVNAAIRPGDYIAQPLTPATTLRGSASSSSSDNGRDVGTVSPTMTSPTDAFAGWLVQVGDAVCAGVLISSTAVLTSETCATHALDDEQPSVRVWPVTTDATHNALHSGAQRIPVVRNKAAAMSNTLKRGYAAFDFAVLKLAQPAPATPIALLATWDDHVAKGRAMRVVGVRHSRTSGDQPTQVTYDTSDATSSVVVAGSTIMLALGVDVRESCAALHPVSADAGTSASPTFLVMRLSDGQRAALVGVSPALQLACYDTNERGTSRNKFVRATSLQNLIDGRSAGHSWVRLSNTGSSAPTPTPTKGKDAPTPTKGKGKGKGTPTPTKTNSTNSTGSNGDGSRMNAATLDPHDIPRFGDPDADTGSEPPTAEPPSQSPVTSEFVGMLSVEDAESARFGPPIALIAPTFAVTRAQWIVDSGVFGDANSSSANSTVVAVFDGVATPVKQLVYQQRASDADASDLVVLELAEPAVRGASPIAAAMLFDVASPRFVLEAIDAATGPDGPATNEQMTLWGLSLSACRGAPSTGADDDDVICANVPRVNELTLQHHLVALNQGFLFDGDALIGLSARNASEASSSRLHDTFAFFQLAAPRHYDFVNNATRGTVEWPHEPVKDVGRGSSSGDGDGDNTVGDGVPTRTQREFPSYIVGFEGDASVDWSCQGILVAPAFVLTTASCTQDRSISTIVFPLRNHDSFRMPYDPTATIVHPRYNASAPPDERFDFAILPLGFTTDIAPARLSLGSTSQADDELLAFEGAKLKSERFIGAGAPEPVQQTPVKFHQQPNCAMSKPSNTSVAHRLSSLCLKKKLLPPQATPSKVPGNAQHVGIMANEDEYPGIVKNPTKSLDRSVIGRELNDTVSASTNNRGTAAATHASYSVMGFAAAVDDDDDGMYSVIPLTDAAVFVNAFVAGAAWEAGGVIVNGPQQIANRFIVGLRASKSGQNFCGGSLIASTSVLTAAHCVTDGLANWVSIGSKAVTNGIGTEEIQVVKRSVVVHASYGKPSKFSFDAAIFELASPAYADPVVLDDSPDFADGEMATMFGYGTTATNRISSTMTASTNNEATRPTEIRAVDLSLMSLEKCAKTLPDIDNSMLCAVGKDGADACQGDSGGPLVLPSQQSSRDVLVGFVSSGYDCGLKNVPGIYMRVSSLAQFIKDNTAGAKWSSFVASQPPTPPSPSSPSVRTSTPTLSDDELRNLDNLRPRENVLPSGSGPNGAVPTTSPTPDLNALTTRPPIRSMDAPQSLNPQVRGALLLYLLGVSDARIIPAATLERLASESNVVRFFSTGDLSSVLAIIRRHNDNALYVRSDRFGRRKQHVAALPLESVVARISDVCSS